jgi:hypothetical protein
MRKWESEFDMKTTRASLWRMTPSGGRVEFDFDLRQFIVGANYYKRDIYGYVNIFIGFFSFTYVRFLDVKYRKGKP